MEDDPDVGEYIRNLKARIGLKSPGKSTRFSPYSAFADETGVAAASRRNASPFDGSADGELALLQARTRITSLESTVTTLHRDLDEAKLMHARGKDAFIAAQEKAEKKISALERELLQLVVKEKSFSESADRIRRQSFDSDKRLTEELSKANMKILVLENELNAAQADSERRLSVMQRELFCAQEKVHALTSSAEEMNEQVVSSQRQQMTLFDQFKESMESASVAKQRVQELEKELGQLRVNSATAIALSQDLAELKRLKIDNESLRRDVTKYKNMSQNTTLLSEEKASLLQKLQGLEKQYKDVLDENSQLKEVCARDSAGNLSYAKLNQVDSLTKQCVRLSSELGFMQDRQRQLEANLSRHEENLQDMHNKSNLMELTLADRDDAVEQLESQCTELRQDLEQQQCEAASWRTVVDQLRADLSLAQQEPSKPTESSVERAAQTTTGRLYASRSPSPTNHSPSPAPADHTLFDDMVMDLSCDDDVSGLDDESAREGSPIGSFSPDSDQKTPIGSFSPNSEPPNNNTIVAASPSERLHVAVQVDGSGECQSCVKLRTTTAELEASITEKTTIINELKEKLSTRGDYVPETSKVLHMRVNPLEWANKEYHQQLKSLGEENGNLKLRLEEFESLRSGEEMSASGDQANVTIRVAQKLAEGEAQKEIEDLQKQIGDLSERHSRQLEVNRQTARRYREVTAALTGYQVKLKDERGHRQGLQTYEVQSIYESRDAHFIFQRSDAGSIELLDSDYAHQWPDFLDAYLGTDNSFPAFLSAVTLQLYNRSNQSSSDTTI